MYSTLYFNKRFHKIFGKNFDKIFIYHEKYQRNKCLRERNGKGGRQGCPLSATLFNIYMEALMKNCFLNTVCVNIGGRRIKCMRFADDMALLAGDERMLKSMLMELNDKCEDYGMKIP